jgi:hypothetical protein
MIAMANIYKIKGTMNKKTTVYLRYQATSEWRASALKKANYKCEISGKKSCGKNPLVVHHLTKSFNEIVRDAHKQLDIDFHKTIDDYKEDDLKALVELIKDIHKEVEAIVLVEGLHDKIHEMFGANPKPEEVKAYKKEYRRKQYKHKNSGYKKIA